MSTFDLLVVSLVTFSAEAVLLWRWPVLRSRLLSQRRIINAIVAAVVLCAASAVISTERSSGTGTSTQYGFPLPFYFTWESWEGPESSAGFGLVYSCVNAMTWAAATSFVLLCVTASSLRRPSQRAHPESGQTTTRL